jgi:hypothetical protein
MSPDTIAASYAALRTSSTPAGERSAGHLGGNYGPKGLTSVASSSRPRNPHWTVQDRASAAGMPRTASRVWHARKSLVRRGGQILTGCAQAAEQSDL